MFEEYQQCPDCKEGRVITTKKRLPFDYQPDPNKNLFENYFHHLSETRYKQDDTDEMRIEKQKLRLQHLSEIIDALNSPGGQKFLKVIRFSLQSIDCDEFWRARYLGQREVEQQLAEQRTGLYTVLCNITSLEFEFDKLKENIDVLQASAQIHEQT